MADHVSRLHESPHCRKFVSYLEQTFQVSSDSILALSHMSYASFYFLLGKFYHIG